MNKIVLFVIVPLLIILLGIGSVLGYRKFFTPQKTHYHAGIVVFQNNKKLDFSDNKFMFLEPCALGEEHDDSPQIIQIEKAHLHDNVGDLVHVERTGAIWRDLFTNMHYSIDYSKTKGFINGKETANYQFSPIKNDDSLVVFIGNSDKGLLKQAVTKEYIEKMAKKSTLCSE